MPPPLPPRQNRSLPHPTRQAQLGQVQVAFHLLLQVQLLAAAELRNPNQDKIPVSSPRAPIRPLRKFNAQPVSQSIAACAPQASTLNTKH